MRLTPAKDVAIQREGEAFKIIKISNLDTYLVEEDDLKIFLLAGSTDFDSSLLGKKEKISDFQQREFLVSRNEGESYLNTKEILKKIDDTTFSHLTLRSIFLSVTSKCPYECDFCCRPSSKNVKLSLSNIKNTLKDCKKFGCSKLVISGGEPTTCTSYYLKEIFKFSKEIGYQNVLFTTGYRAQPVKSSLSYIDEIRVSLDFPDKQHNILRGHGEAYQRCIYFIKKFSKNNTKMGINTVIFNTDPKHITSLINFAVDNELDYIRFNIVAPVGKANKLKYSLNPSAIKKIQKRVKNASKQFKEINIYTPRPENREYPKALVCEGGFTAASIKADGGITACPYIPNIVEGNVKKTNFKKIWKNKNNFKKFRKISPLNKACKNCSMRKFCIANCKAMAYALFDDMFLKEPPQTCNLV